MTRGRLGDGRVLQTTGLGLMMFEDCRCIIAFGICSDVVCTVGQRRGGVGRYELL
jgi:hypothetical protein